MATTIDVPVNTMIADLDTGLRDLLLGPAQATRLRRHRRRLRHADDRMGQPAHAADGQPLPLRPAALGQAGPERPRGPPPRQAHASSASRRCASTASSRSRRGRRPSPTSTGCCRRCSACSTPIRSSTSIWAIASDTGLRASRSAPRSASSGPSSGRTSGVRSAGVQAGAGLRRHAVGGERHRLRARAGCAHDDGAHHAHGPPARDVQELSNVGGIVRDDAGEPSPTRGSRSPISDGSR